MSLARTLATVGLICFFQISAYAQDVSKEVSKKISMTCYDRFYRCSIDWQGMERCMWVMDGAVLHSFPLIKDTRYPSPDYPHEIWNGIEDSAVHGGTITLKTTFTDNPDWPYPVDTKIKVSYEGIVAESSGEKFVQASLRTARNGIGRICHSIKVHD